MKNKFALLLAGLLLMGSVSACGGSAGNASAAPGTSAAAAPGTAAAGSKAETTAAGQKTDGKPLKIVATIFPEYDWTREILGENPGGAELTILMDSGADLHSYQPSAEDMMNIAACDLFIYVGGESDRWVGDALKNAVNPDQRALNLMELLGDRAKEEEIVEGMEAGEHEHDHGHEEGEHHDHEEEGEHHDHEEGEGHEDHDHEETEWDEHIWLSVKNASFLCGEISSVLGDMDPDNKDVYAANAAAYREKLDALDAEYQKAVDGAANKTLLFGDRFPFRYLTDDYGLEYYAAFVGCSAETEASFETVAFLAKKVDELSLPCVMTIEGKDHRLAETIVRSTEKKDQKILTLNSMQSTTQKEIDAGATYLSIMEENMNVLKEAL